MGCNHSHALDLAKEGRWDDAHRLVQEYFDEGFCLIHGYLHRVEGDLDNAEYWYRRAGGKIPDNQLEEEFAMEGKPRSCKGSRIA